MTHGLMIERVDRVSVLKSLNLTLIKQSSLSIAAAGREHQLVLRGPAADPLVDIVYVSTKGGFVANAFSLMLHNNRAIIDTHGKLPKANFRTDRHFIE